MRNSIHRTSSLDTLLRPRSIGIIGVSRDQGRQSSINGSAVLESLTRFGYAGRIDLVHPEAREIAGRVAYPSIAALPEAPDLMVIALAAGAVPDAIAACGEKGVRAAVVMSAGFSELGSGEGTEIERRTREAAGRHGVRICGPNGLGYINVADGIYAGYFPCLANARPKTGGLSIVTHSGAVGNSLVARAIDRGVGLGMVVSAGNETNVTLADYIDFLIDDPGTRVIALYMEGVVDGMSLRRALARAAAARKAVVAYKVGKSPAGAKAALSHTAKVAGDHALYRGLFRQFGVIEAQGLDDLIEVPMLLLKCMDRGSAPPRGLGVVTISGGLGAILADHFAQEGFEIPELSSRTRTSLEALPLKFGSTANPVDTTAAIQRTESTLADIIAAVAADPGIDAVVFPNAARFPERAQDVARIMVATAERIDKPLISVWYAGSDNDPAMRLLHESPNVPCFDDPAACGRALAGLRDFRRHAARVQDTPVAPPPDARGRVGDWLPREGMVNEEVGKRILAAYGVALPRETLVDGAQAAADAARAIGFPVALKVVSADIAHKARVGGVKLALRSESEVRSAYAAMLEDVRRHAPGARIEGALVSEMVDIRLEFIVGAFDDPHLGPALLVGMGGGEVERLRDAAMCVVPASATTCAGLVDELADPRARTLDQEDRAALGAVVARIAAMAADIGPRLAELDVNPVALTRDGRVLALDAMMRFTPAPGEHQ